MEGMAAIFESVGNITRRSSSAGYTGPEHSGSVGSRVVRSVQAVGRGMGGIGGDRSKAALW